MTEVKSWMQGSGKNNNSTTVHAHSTRTHTRYPGYKGIKVGNIVSFSWQDSVTYKRVRGVFEYKDFESMLQAEGVQSCLPHLEDGEYERGVRVYHAFRDYETLAKKYGVVAFRLGDVTVSPVSPLNRRQQIALMKSLSRAGWCFFVSLFPAPLYFLRYPPPSPQVI